MPDIEARLDVRVQVDRDRREHAQDHLGDGVQDPEKRGDRRAHRDRLQPASESVHRHRPRPVQRQRMAQAGQDAGGGVVHEVPLEVRLVSGPEIFGTHLRLLLVHGGVEPLRRRNRDPLRRNRLRRQPCPAARSRQRSADHAVRCDHAAVGDLHGTDGRGSGCEDDPLPDLGMPARAGPAADAQRVAAVEHRAAPQARAEGDEDFTAWSDPDLALDPGAHAEARLGDQASNFERQDVEGAEYQRLRPAGACIDPTPESVGGKRPECPRREEKPQSLAEGDSAMDAAKVCEIGPDATPSTRNVPLARHPTLRCKEGRYPP